MDATEWILKDRERKKSIKLPSCLFNQEISKVLDRKIATHNPSVISSFYENWENHIDKEVFIKISKELEKIDKINEEDSKILDFLCKKEKIDPEIFLDFVGNLYYIEDLLSELNEHKDLSKTIRISLILFCYLNLVEIFNKYISDIVREHIESNNLFNEYKKYLEKFDEFSYPEIGPTLNALKNLSKLSREELDRTILGRNRLLRNKISHANIYYDKGKDLFYTVAGPDYSISDFIKDFGELHNFVKNMAFRLNGDSSDVLGKVCSAFKELRKKYLAVGRSHLSKSFRYIKFEWE